MPKLQVFLESAAPVSHEIADGKTTVGRVADNDLQIDDVSVSSHHAEIVERDGAFVLKDLGSTNGTELNGAPVTESLLSPGDEIRFGNIRALFLEEELMDEVRTIPEQEAPPQADSAGSARPPGFVNTSPFPKADAPNKAIPMAGYALAVLALLAFVMLVLSVFGLTLPAFPAP